MRRPIGVGGVFAATKTPPTRRHKLLILFADVGAEAGLVALLVDELGNPLVAALLGVGRAQGNALGLHVLLGLPVVHGARRLEDFLGRREDGRVLLQQVLRQLE